MQHLCFLQQEKNSFYYHKISNYNKASEKCKEALDDNAEVIFHYYNGLQNINKNVKTLTTITIVYCIIILIGVLGFLFQLFKLL